MVVARGPVRMLSHALLTHVVMRIGRELPLGFREEPVVSRAARVMPCPLGIWTRGTGRLPPSTPPAVTA